MKSKVFLHIIVASFLLISSCKKESMGDCFKPTGKIVLEQRLIDPFRDIQLEGGMNLFITPSPTLELSVKAGKNLQKLIKTEVKGSTLFISNENKCNWVRSSKKEINIYLKTPEIRDFEYFGWGEVQFTDTLVVDTFRLNLWEASGDLSFKLNTQYLELKSNTGTGTISAEGNTNEIVLFNGGHGFIDAFHVNSSRALAVIENTGLINLTVDQFLKADISGEGNINYKGNPTIERLGNGKGNLIRN